MLARLRPWLPDRFYAERRDVGGRLVEPPPEFNARRNVRSPHARSAFLLLLPSCDVRLVRRDDESAAREIAAAAAGVFGVFVCASARARARCGQSSFDFRLLTSVK